MRVSDRHLRGCVGMQASARACRLSCQRIAPPNSSMGSTPVDSKSMEQMKPMLEVYADNSKASGPCEDPLAGRAFDL